MHLENMFDVDLTNDLITLTQEASNKIINIVIESLAKLRLNESELFENETSESTLKYRFSKIFESELDISSTSESSKVRYFIDMEYNRSRRDVKVVDHEIYNFSGNNKKITRGRTTFDLIVHQRGSTNNYPENLIHFEFKGINSKDNGESDIERIKMTTSKANDSRVSKMGLDITYGQNRREQIVVRGYQIGFFIKFGKLNDKLVVIKNGEVISNFEL